MPRMCACGNEIPQGRIDVFGDSDPRSSYCVECSTEEKILGVMGFDHKTAPSLVIVDPRNKEAVRRVTQQIRRTRWAG